MKFLFGILPNAESSKSPYRLSDFLIAFHNAVLLTMFRVLLGRLWKIGPKGKYFRDCQVSHDFVDCYVNEAIESKPTSEDLGGIKSKMSSRKSLVQSLSSQTDDELRIRVQIIQGMPASAETISAIIGNTFLLLSRHQVYWQRLHNECLTKGSDIYNFDSLLNCKLVQNILRECKWLIHMCLRV
jgi:cytochrome P450